MEKWEIPIHSENFGGETLRELLFEEIQTESTNVRLKLKNIPNPMRDPTSDPALLVAIVGGVSGAFSALIHGLFNLLEKHKLGKQPIKLTWADGSSLSIPSDTTDEDIEKFIKMIETKDSPTIHV